MNMRSPLSRARGHGSSKDGVEHWWAQRLTAVALIPLSFWFVYSMVTMVGSDFVAYHAWVGAYGNSILLILFAMTLFHHTQLGVQVIIEDYVQNGVYKVGGIILTKLIAVFGGASCVVAILRISFGS